MKSNFYIEFYEPTQIFVHRIVNHFVRPEFLLNAYDISLHIRLRSFMIYNSLVPFVKAQVSLEQLTSRLVARIWESKTEKIIRAVFILFCTTSLPGRGQTPVTRSINQSQVNRPQLWSSHAFFPRFAQTVCICPLVIGLFDGHLLFWLARVIRWVLG